MSKYKDEDYNAAAFADAARHLRSLGHDVVTPHERNAVVWREHKNRAYDPKVDKCDYGDPMLNYMVADDLTQVCHADAIALLPEWEQSQGTLRELYVATLLGKRVLDATTGKDIAVMLAVKAARFTPPVMQFGEQLELFPA